MRSGAADPRVNPGTSGRIKLGDIAEVKRGYSEPPDVKVRANGKQGIAIGISMAKGGDIIALGKGLQKQVAEVRKQLPVGMELTQVQDQPQAVTRSVGEFVSTLILAIVIVLLVSFVSLGLHFNPIRIDIWPGLVVAHHDPAGARDHLRHDVLLGRRLAQDLAGLADHRAGPARRRRDHRGGDDGAQDRGGLSRERAATFAYEVTAMPMLTGTLITAAGFLPIGLAKSMTGEYTFAIFAVTSVALLISWLVSVFFVPYLGALLLQTRQAAQPGRQHPRTARDLRLAVLRALPPPGGVVRQHRRT